MIERTKVKIVKKTDVVVRKTAKRKANTPRVAAREMVSTVTEWVTDFHERKRDETKAAIENLFGAKPQPTET